MGIASVPERGLTRGTATRDSARDRRVHKAWPRMGSDEETRRSAEGDWRGDGPTVGSLSGG